MRPIETIEGSGGTLLDRWDTASAIIWSYYNHISRELSVQIVFLYSARLIGTMKYTLNFIEPGPTSCGVSAEMKRAFRCQTLTNLTSVQYSAVAVLEPVQSRSRDPRRLSTST